MALIFHKPDLVQPVMPPVKPGFNWDVWYQKNKQRLSEKRSKRYREDAAYRTAALERSRAQREAQKAAQPAVTDYTVSFMDAAAEIGVTVWVLREWRKKNYFPEPHRRDGRLWFTSDQVNLLRKIGKFFAQHGSRVTEALRPSLESVTSVVYANWA